MKKGFIEEKIETITFIKQWQCAVVKVNK